MTRVRLLRVVIAPGGCRAPPPPPVDERAGDERAPGAMGRDRSPAGLAAKAALQRRFDERSGPCTQDDDCAPAPMQGDACDPPIVAHRQVFVRPDLDAIGELQDVVAASCSFAGGTCEAGPALPECRAGRCVDGHR